MIKLKGVKVMIKKIAWETFKNTGDINTFMELKQIEEIEKEIERHSLMSLGEGLENGKCENKWNCIGRK